MTSIRTAIVAAFLALPIPVTHAQTQVCWIEFSRGQAPGAMGAAGATAPIWYSTVSGLLVRHPKGDVLIDAGWSIAATEQMEELSADKRPTAQRILASLTSRTSAPDALRQVNITSAQLRYIVPTHIHYDHLAGAEDLPGSAILLDPAEIEFARQQELVPDIVARSNLRAVKDRFTPIRFKPEPHLGFERSFDLYGDGAIVVVPLPGHTPGSVGIFIEHPEGVIFHVGDTAWVAEGIERNLPKIPPMRAFADHDGPATDRQVAALHDFHAAHPGIAMLPAHDRLSWEAALEKPGCRN